MLFPTMEDNYLELVLANQIKAFEDGYREDHGSETVLYGEYVLHCAYTPQENKLVY